MSETTATGAHTGADTPDRDPSPEKDKPKRTVAGSNISLGHSLGLILALGALVVLGIITGGDRFLSVDNLMVILQQAAVIGVVSIGVTFVITSGGIDLSVGSVFSTSRSSR